MPHVRKLRLPLTLLIIVNLTMIGVQLLLYPQLLEMQGVIVFIAEPVVILHVYGIVFYWLTNNNVQQDEILWGAIPFGLFSGVLEISHISIEVFGHLTPRSETISTGLFLCVVFIPWGVAGYWLTRKRGKMTGLLTGSFSAMLCMLLVVTYGFLQLFWALPHLIEKNIGSPDLIRSGWTDLKAFTIADIFASGFKVLLVGPIVGWLLGTVGGLIALLAIWRKSNSKDSLES